MLWTVPMTWTYRGHATVEAKTDEEAVERAKRFHEEVDLQEATAELVDWDVTGPADKIS